MKKGDIVRLFQGCVMLGISLIEDETEKAFRIKILNGEYRLFSKETLKIIPQNKKEFYYRIEKATADDLIRLSMLTLRIQVFLLLSDKILRNSSIGETELNELSKLMIKWNKREAERKAKK